MIYVKTRSHLNISNSWFERNNAHDSGGSIAIEDSYVFIRFSNFHSEHAFSSFGGSICALDAGFITIIHSKFTNCTANNGGTVSLMIGSDMDIKHSSIMNSQSHENGGAVYVYSECKVRGKYLSLLNCEAQSGGAIFLEDASSLILNNSLINGNVAHSGNGGGIYSTHSGIKLHHCIFSDNKGSGQGGGVYVKVSNMKVNNVSLYMNRAVTYGGGIFATTSHVDIHNSEGENNYAAKSGGLMFFDRTQLLCQHVHVYDNMSLSGSVIVIKNSHADVHFLYYDYNNSFCPIVAISKSYLKVEGLYGMYNISIMPLQNKTIGLEGHVCRDDSSEVNGLAITGNFFAMNSLQ